MDAVGGEGAGEPEEVAFLAAVEGAPGGAGIPCGGGEEGLEGFEADADGVDGEEEPAGGVGKGRNGGLKGGGAALEPAGVVDGNHILETTRGV